MIRRTAYRFATAGLLLAAFSFANGQELTPGPAKRESKG